MSSPHTTILPPGSVPVDRLTYVIIGAFEGGRWIFVRHRQRSTWEMPAGHIEKEENPDHSALRELYEETGTVRSDLRHICDYQVEENGKNGYGRLYGARVLERESIPKSEISEIRLEEFLPENLTYPEVQTVLFSQVKQQLLS
ncbi:MAG: NUDIX domain-containing protein [Bacteroidota bacterium]